ncbi:class I SAM-dependent methyltransferase [Streptomyces sp. NBC_00083]|uniref:class I SAM-dependent methyltransferase n=1 Tax=Streptomyces sp. NBC_00083 TaxID=2975647 RepID=UPI002251C873|nr:class I SAM-dependent methyltransferase [Streptomyces sp. NBC_00083]MCX5388011.1 class I SAM-dependent methyltransferase [Streptomyces sp. NBC_00083]
MTTPAVPHPARAHSFNAAAAQYAANRPSYPPLLLDALEELADRPLKGARVADVGAGTGIASALLHDRGARVVAVEPGAGMAAQFRTGNPGIPLVRGDGNDLPLATASADLITYAQAWHWTDPAKAGPEACRVLRPGGALALWWNIADHSAQWLAAQDARIRDFLGVDRSAEQRAVATRSGSGAAESAAEPAERGAHPWTDIPGLDFAERRIPHTRKVPLATHLANLGSHSAFLVIGEERAREFLATEHAVLSELFPDGTVEERYVVHLLLART